MLHELDSSLTTLLKNSLPAEIAGSLGYSFASPDASFPPAGLSLPVVNFFLYSVLPNTELRNNAPSIQRLPNGAVQKVRPPVYLDCVYLVTVWPKADSNDPAEEEHTIFGNVLRALLSSPTWNGPVGTGAAPAAIAPAAGTPVADSATLLQPVAGRIAEGFDATQWMGGRPKLSAKYVVTAAMPLGEPEPAVLVTEKQIRFRQMEQAAAV